MRAEIDYERLGRRIKEVRQQRGLTQEYLAARVDCNTSHISNIENCYTKPSLNALLAIANVLETSVDYLLSEQLNEVSSALDKAILRALQGCDDEKKEKILKIIAIL